MTKTLEGKIAVITGGGTGIGLATAKKFVAEGAYVFITGRRRAELDAAVSALDSKAFAVQADVSNLSDLDRLYIVNLVQNAIEAMEEVINRPRLLSIRSRREGTDICRPHMPAIRCMARVDVETDRTW